MDVYVETHYEYYKYIEGLLNKRQLSKALSQLRDRQGYPPDWNNKNEWTEINDTFIYMLDYLKKGIADEHRETMFKQLLSRAYQLNDRLLYRVRMRSAEDEIAVLRKDLEAEEFPLDMVSLLPLLRKWGTIMKGVETSPLDDPAGDSTIIRNYEHFYTRLFNAVYTSSCWTKDDLEAALQVIDDPEVYEYDLLLLESAVLMNLSVGYDENKLRFLIGLVRQAHDYTVQARAIVGIAICCFRHADRMLLNDDLISVLTKDLPENPVYLEGMRLLQKEFFICQQTDSTAKKMDEEILPAMMKSTYFRPTKFGFQNVEDYLNPKDSDPGGETEEGRKDIEKKLREMNDMHLNGLDVYMTTFSHLKNFPFFNTLANWFYPFNPYHYTVKGVYFTEGKKMNILASILKDISFCNSDKYSFSLLLGKVGTFERKLMAKQIEQSLGGQDVKDLMMKYQGLQFMLEIRMYLQDLYRFYKLYPSAYKVLIFNPFEGKLNFFHNPLLSQIVDDEDSLLAIAEAVYNVGNYEEALVYLQRLDRRGSRHASVYQREGYCLQTLQKYREAVDAYLKADLIRPGEMWTCRQLGYCYRHLREYGKALGFYLKMEEAEPDNKFILLRTGECLLQEKRYQEALQRFFKVEYTEPQYLPALRAIAWCAFLSGDLERAKKYYGKILKLIKRQTDNHLSAEWATDYLNAGHTALVSGNLSEAVLLYRKYAECSGTTEYQELWDDFPILKKKYHCNRLDMQLIIEAAESK